MAHSDAGKGWGLAAAMRDDYPSGTGPRLLASFRKSLGRMLRGVLNGAGQSNSDIWLPRDRARPLSVAFENPTLLHQLRSKGHLVLLGPLTTARASCSKGLPEAL